MSDTLWELDDSFDRALKKKFSKQQWPIHQQMKYTEPETKSSCCGRTNDQIIISQGGRMSMTLDSARVTCKPYGTDLNKAWQRLTDELEAARCHK